MDSTDADDDNICNSSIGREIMQTVTSRRSNRRVSLNFLLFQRVFITNIFSRVRHTRTKIRVFKVRQVKYRIFSVTWTNIWKRR